MIGVLRSLRCGRVCKAVLAVVIAVCDGCFDCERPRIRLVVFLVRN